MTKIILIIAALAMSPCMASNGLDTGRQITVTKSVTDVNGNTYTVGQTLTIGTDVTASEAQHLLSSNRAEWINLPITPLPVGGVQTVTTTPTATGHEIELSNGGGTIEIPKNRSFLEVFKTTKSFGNGNAVLINTFAEVTIQAGKKVKLTLKMPVRASSATWGGGHININVKVNGTWHNLGNGGYDGATMYSGATAIATHWDKRILDIPTALSITGDYTFQVEVMARSYSGTVTVNGSHDINRVANNLGVRGALKTWGSDQNFTTLFIEESD